MIRIILVILLALTHPAARADFEADLSATSVDVQALRELHTRASAGDADAQFALGGVFFKGQSVERDYAEAVRWFRLAAAQGHSRAQFNLGMMYATAQGVTQDNAEAVKWYRLAANRGLAIAQLNLGAAYATGQGVTLNWGEAAKWMRLAADQNEAQAQFNLAVMYAKGQGVDKSLPNAYRYAKLAAAQGHETAKSLLADLEKQVPAEQAPRTDKPAADAAPAKAMTDQNVYIQLGALKSQNLAKSHAERFLTEMRTRLGDVGKPYSIYTEDGWVRIQLGPYTNTGEARHTAKSLESKLGYQPMLKRRNKPDESGSAGLSTQTP